jgi:GxxExxY protein
MIIEMQEKQFTVEQEKLLHVYYRNQIVGEFYVDVLVEEKVIVELKSVQHLTKDHEVQVVNYLNGLHLDIGLLINFGPQSVDVRRKYRSLTSTEEC